MTDSWTDIEVQLIVADYFNMLYSDLKGLAYSKSGHRRALIPLLKNRSEGSIEFKHQNISAVLINLGQPYIKGYLPRFNYQKILEEKVLEYLNRHIDIEEQFLQFAVKEIKYSNRPYSFESFIVRPPEFNHVEEPQPTYTRKPIKVNYLEKEQKNQALGQFGEELVIQFEKWSLIKLGKENLADKVEWISKEQGDGAGFDILSRQPDGRDKYIEVKSTKLSKETPFYFSRNELDFSIEHSSDYHLYRLFNLEADPKMFIKQGSFDAICKSTPIKYKGYF